MKKKILSFILAICLIIPAMFMLTACGGNDEGSDAISETEWKNIICEKNFTTSLNYSMRCEPEYFYEIYSGKDDSSIETVYLKPGYYKVVNNGGNWWNAFEVSSKEEYDTNISSALNIVNYAKNNKSAFTARKQGSVTKYVANIPSSLRADLESLANILHANNGEEFSHAVNVIVLYKETKTLEGKTYTNTCLEVASSINASNNEEKISFIFDNAVSQYWVKKEVESLKSFSIIGGPSKTDVDYSEVYFVNNGFRIYFPNRVDATQRDVYYQYDLENDTYYVYRQDEGGNWSKNTTNKVTYDNVRNQTLNLYFGNIVNNTQCLKYSQHFHTIGRRGNYIENKAISYETAQGTWWYYDIKLSSVSTCVKSVSYKMKMTTGDASTSEYNMQLSTENITLTYPVV